jgi:hypothetical protein
MQSLWLALRLSTSGDTILLYGYDLEFPHYHSEDIPSGVTIRSADDSQNVWVMGCMKVEDNIGHPSFINGVGGDPKESYFCLSAADVAAGGDYIGAINGTAATYDATEKLWGAGSMKFSTNTEMQVKTINLHGRRFRLHIGFKCDTGAKLACKWNAIPNTATAANDRRSLDFQNGGWNTNGYYDLYDADGNLLDDSHPGRNVNGWASVVTKIFSPDDALAGAAGSSTSVLEYFKSLLGASWVQYIFFEVVPEWTLADATLNIWTQSWDESGDRDNTANSGRSIPASWYASTADDLSDYASYHVVEGSNLEGNITGITTADPAVFTDVAHGLATGQHILLNNVKDYDDFGALRETLWEVELNTAGTPANEFFLIYPGTTTKYDSTGKTFGNQIRWQLAPTTALQGSRGSTNSKYITFCAESGKTMDDYVFLQQSRADTIEFVGTGAEVRNVNTCCAQHGFMDDAAGTNELHDCADYNSLSNGMLSIGTGTINAFNWKSYQSIASSYNKEYGGGLRAGEDTSPDVATINLIGGYVDKCGDDSYQPIGAGVVNLYGCVSKDAHGNDIELNCSNSGSMIIHGFTGNGALRDQSTSATTVVMSGVVVSRIEMDQNQVRTYTVGDGCYCENSNVSYTGGAPAVANLDNNVTFDYVVDYDTDTFVPLSTSVLLGDNVRWWTGKEHVGGNGEPYSDFAPDAGGIHSTHSWLHPFNQ